MEVQRLASPGHLAHLTAIYYTVTYLGFAAPYILALASHLAGYPVLLAVTAGLALLTVPVIRRPLAPVTRTPDAGPGQRPHESAPT